MRRFKKRADISVAFIPGYGRVGPSAVLEGDQWAKYCPALLVEVAAGAEAPKPVVVPVPVAASPSPPAPEVIVPPPPAPEPVPAPAPAPEPVADPPKLSAAAEAGFPSPEELQAVVAAENASTEAQIAKVVDQLGAEEKHVPAKMEAKVELKKEPVKPKSPSKGNARRK